MTGGASGGSGVVIHLDEDDSRKQASVLTNISNLLTELGPGAELELVGHGPGLGAALTGSGTEEQLLGLLARGVVVSACANTMRATETPAERLIVGVQVVPSGVAQLVRRQRQGWAYLRP